VCLDLEQTFPQDPHIPTQFLRVTNNTQLHNTLTHPNHNVSLHTQHKKPFCFPHPSTLLSPLTTYIYFA